MLYRLHQQNKRISYIFWLSDWSHITGKCNNFSFYLCHIDFIKPLRGCFRKDRVQLHLTRQYLKINFKFIYRAESELSTFSHTHTLRSSFCSLSGKINCEFSTWRSSRLWSTWPFLCYTMDPSRFCAGVMTGIAPMRLRLGPATLLGGMTGMTGVWLGGGSGTWLGGASYSSDGILLYWDLAYSCRLEGDMEPRDERWLPTLVKLRAVEIRLFGAGTSSLWNAESKTCDPYIHTQKWSKLVSSWSALIEGLTWTPAS